MSARLSAFAALNNSDSDSNPNSNSNSDSENENDLSQQNNSNIPPNSIFSIDLGLGNGSVSYDSSNNQFIPILNSNFTLSKSENIIYNDDHIILGLHYANILVIKGQYKLSIIQGSLLIDSYILNDPNQELIINASNLNSLPCLKPLKKDNKSNNLFKISFSCIIKLSNFNDNMSDLTLLSPHYKSLYSSDQISKNSTCLNYTFTILHEPEQNKIATSIPDSWEYHLKNLSINLSSSSSSPVVLIIGNKNTGKSTFLKLLANTLLSINCEKSIQVLDMDPGQPEFCLPGCITLSKIKNPLLGTINLFNSNFNNSDNSDNSDNLIKFYGFTSPNIQPLFYLYQLNQLLNKINNCKNTITLINSPGWVKGFGTEILSNLNNSINITNLIQLSNELKDLDLIKEINWNKNITNILKLQSINNLSISNSYSPLFIRNFKLLSYMHYNLINKNFDFNPLIFKSPYRVSYISNFDIKKLNNFNGIIGISIFDSQGINILDLPQILECQFMSIITIPINELINLNNSQNLINYPNLINEMSIKSISKNWKFYGLCVIHSVDIENNNINLYTPININKLINSLNSNFEKLLLIKGRQDLPIEEIYSSQILKKSSYWSNFGLSALPYISESVSNEVVGGKTVGIRRNIQRR
ncbi:hypothetical protein C6P40_002277 [Pichia californica]|uniref:Polynucleotide 5'-hydroxyl-kinase GRC3 n=1 Tax=Pichia californica TaxID=460514 RepID=A0A9P6WIM7_9ASCO|nr:hypothetical protein C6P42_000855 [[Candida] californica]KAG0687494.1 hypothetical protein C6P40_002277 [[Candida] californica]